MIVLVTNPATEKSFIRLNASVKESNYSKIITAANENELVIKTITDYIDSGFSSSIETVNLSLSLSLLSNEQATLETLRMMFDEMGEVVKIALDDSDYFKLSKRLVSKSDKEFARSVSRKKESNDDGVYESYYQLLKDRI